MTLAGVSKNLKEERRYLAEIERAASFLQSMGVPTFTCAQLEATPPEDLNKWKRANATLANSAERRIANQTTLCKNLTSERKSFAETMRAFKGSGLATYVADWDKAKQ